MNQNIAIVGYGNMGKVLYNAFISKVSTNVFPVESDPEVRQGTGVKVYTSLTEVEQPLDYIVLAMKPQSFELFAKQNESYDFSKSTVISIMAGIRVDKIKSLLKTENIVRTMPNIGAQIGMSITGWFTDSMHIDIDEVSQMLFSFGETIHVEDEDDLDSITALFGSGPAYFFYMAEIFAQKALELGCDAYKCEALTQKLLLSSAKLLEANNGVSAKELKDRVTSKGGTTEAALKHMADNNFDTIFKDAIQKAADRSKELSNT